MRRSQPRKDSRGRRGLSLTGTATLAAVVSVLILVSLPRLRGFALRANEREALGTARLLANSVAEIEARDGANARIDALLDLEEIRRRLPDAEILESGRLLRHHGYLFELVHVAPGELPGGGALAARNEPYPLVRAWPWLYGQTGAAALLALPGGTVLGHTNEGPLWSGPDRPPAPTAEVDWFGVR